MSRRDFGEGGTPYRVEWDGSVYPFGGEQTRLEPPAFPVYPFGGERTLDIQRERERERRRLCIPVGGEQSDSSPQPCGLEADDSPAPLELRPEGWA